MEKEVQKSKLHISQNDFIDIITTAVATPAVREEIEHQVESSEDCEIVINEN